MSIVTEYAALMENSQEKRQKLIGNQAKLTNRISYVHLNPLSRYPGSDLEMCPLL